MNWRGYREVPVKKLVLPGDISRRQKLSHVIELARDIRELGDEPIHAPTVHVETYALIAGRDRMAALLLNKATKVWVRLAMATDEEVGDLEVSENLYRRQDNRDELIARRFHKLVEEFKERDAQLSDAVSHNAGRRATPETRAAVALADDAGVTPRSIRRAVAREEEPEAQEEPAAPDPMGDYNVALEAIRHGIDTQARAASKMAQSTTMPVAPWAHLARELRQQGDLLANYRLVGPCPVCDGGDCSLCGGCRYITEFQAAGLPKEERRPLLKAPRRKAKLRIKDEHGAEIVVEKTEPESEELF